jgi:protein-S-isoprenylcysteine O-methyltransferase Ste14
MSASQKVFLIAAFIALAIGISTPFQNVSTPIYLGFLPASIFYLLIVHVLFVAFIGYMAFFTRLHGRAENEEEFLAEVRREKEGGK